MNFEFSEKVIELCDCVKVFMDQYVFFYELDYGYWVEDEVNIWKYLFWFEDFKDKVKDVGIWNWFLLKDYEEFSFGLLNFEFVFIMEVMVQVFWV